MSFVALLPGLHHNNHHHHHDNDDLHNDDHHYDHDDDHHYDDDHLHNDHDDNNLHNDDHLHDGEVRQPRVPRVRQAAVRHQGVLLREEEVPAAGEKGMLEFVKNKNKYKLNLFL